MEEEYTYKPQSPKQDKPPKAPKKPTTSRKRARADPIVVQDSRGDIPQFQDLDITDDKKDLEACISVLARDMKKRIPGNNRIIKQVDGNN